MRGHLLPSLLHYMRLWDKRSLTLCLGLGLHWLQGPLRRDVTSQVADWYHGVSLVEKPFTGTTGIREILVRCPEVVEEQPQMFH